METKARFDGRLLNHFLLLFKVCIEKYITWRFFYLIILILLSVLELVIYNSVGEISSKFIGTFIDGFKNNFSSKPFLDVLWLSLVIIFISAVVKTVREFVEDSLVNLWRKKLTKRFQNMYLSDYTFYKLIYGKNIDNTDQRITRDIETWTKLFGSILIKVVNSPLSIIYYTFTTFRSVGWQGPVLCYVYFIVGTLVNRYLMNIIVPLWYKQEIFEGDFRFSHMTLRSNAESIAFYSGSEWELNENKKYLNQVIANKNAIIKRNSILKFHMNLFGYVGAIFNYIIIGFSIYILKTFRGFSSPGDFASAILYSSFQCLALIFGFTQFIQLGSEVSELSGHTSRLGEMYEEMTINQKKVKKEVKGENCDFIEMVNVNVFTPDKQLIIPNLSFKVTQGNNMLITGKSGTGKSSILRVLSGIWDPNDGSIKKPDDLYYVPQQTYTRIGILKDQISYPNLDEISEETLCQLLKTVKLEYLISKSNQVINWDQLLSPGEKQRISFARLFYKNPKFAVLDESTSAMDVDVEEEMYKECEMRGITLLSVGHRPTLTKYHSQILKLEDKGVWTLKSK